ncbi:MAG: deoxyhypusine synthase family protein [Myxococcota bacterium]
MAAIRSFMESHFLHFNAGEALRAAQAYEAHINAGGKMFVTLAGAASTGRIGRILSRMIQEGKVHGLCCTGANLEEDIMRLFASDEFVPLPNYRDLTAADEQSLFERGINRVTDVGIPETVMRKVEERLLRAWQQACRDDVRFMPHEFLWQALDEPGIELHFQSDPADSWVLTAKAHNIPIWVPGWEDSTTGNMFAAAVMTGLLPHHQCVATGTEQMHRLMSWYIENHGKTSSSPSIGFFQIGGGIAGDFPICAVPALAQDAKVDVPLWGYFCQISDAQAIYGGYSGAPPNEKITWGKLGPDTPRFMIHSDATIVAPLVFAYVLGD